MFSQGLGWMGVAHSQADLVARAVDGDSDALKTVLAGMYPRLCRYIARKVPADLRSWLDAEDVVQEAMVAIVRHIGTFEPHASDSFDRWARTIALHGLRAGIARQRAAKRGGNHKIWNESTRRQEDSMIAFLDQLAGSESTPSRCLARAEATRIIREALDRLPNDDREAVWRVHIEGQPPTEAATEMGRTVRAVHSLCARGRRRLRLMLRSGTWYLG